MRDYCVGIAPHTHDMYILAHLCKLYGHITYIRSLLSSTYMYSVLVSGSAFCWIVGVPEVYMLCDYYIRCVNIIMCCLLHHWYPPIINTTLYGILISL